MLTKLKKFGIVITALVVAAYVFGARQGVLSVRAEDEKAEVYSAVECLRQEQSSGWSVAAFDGNTLTASEDAVATNYTYYTLQAHTGKSYAVNTAGAFVPDKLVHTVSAACYGPDESMVNDEKYSVVLLNDAESKMALVYTAPEAGTLYFQDLAQVAPLHYDERENAGVYGEYRVVKLAEDGTVTQLYPEEGTHKLYASNGAPTTSAWVNSSVEAEEGDKILFVSEKAESTVFSSPSVSYAEFEEVYEFKNFWKWQQINDANYFEVGYRNASGAWQSFPQLETKKGEYDIYPRSQAPYQSAMYWTMDNPYMMAFGGTWVHSSSAPSADGIGDVGYAFKVPHSGYVNIKLNVIGHYQSEVEVWHNDVKLYATSEADRVNIFHYGFTYSQNAVAVKAGDVLYFVQTSELGPSPQDLDPVITYIEDPYKLDENEITLNDGEETDLTLSVNSAFGLDAQNAVWSVEPEGVITVEGAGAVATVKATGAGDAVISVKIGDYAPITCNVTVNAINKFTVSATSATVEEGATAELSVTVTNETISIDDITVIVEDETVATARIDDGLITVSGIAAGTTEVYVQADGSKSVTLIVTVTEKAEVPDSSPSASEVVSANESGCGGSVNAAGTLFALAVIAAVITVKKKVFEN